MSQLGHSLCGTPRGELRGFPCRRVVSMAVDAAIAVSWPVAEVLAERLCRIMVWLLRLALMRATDLREGGCLRPYRWHAGAPADRPTGLGTRGYPWPPEACSQEFGHTSVGADTTRAPGTGPVATRTVRQTPAPDSCAPTSIAELAEVHRKAHVGPEPDTMPASAPASTPARNARASAGSRLTAAACISLPSNGAS